ncbi:MAG: hypothetical protein IJ223_03765 [Clostridia bacterium]|nr:hypothetical protein [Clostridia bacterium]
MQRGWGNSYIVTITGRKIYLETSYDHIKKCMEDENQKEIYILFATWYGKGSMVIPKVDIAAFGKCE